MNIILSKHAQEQMIRRGINHDTVMLVVSQPEHVIVDDENPSIIVCQSLIKENEQTFLLRVFVNRNKQPNVIVTLYKTTKISKYHEGKIR
jgi:hypothetical protein